MRFFFFHSAFSLEDILYAECELFEVEWLDEIVIGTERKSLDLIYLLRESSEKEKWDIFVSCLEHTHQGESVDTRHEAVDDEEVVGLSCDHLKCFFSIEGMVDLISLGREIEYDVLCDDLVVFCDEDFHKYNLVLVPVIPAKAGISY